MIKTARAVFYLIFIYYFIACSSHSRTVNYYNYDLPKSEALDLCRSILTNLGYDINIFGPETNIIVTKPNKIWKVVRRYDYIVYIKVTDKIEIYIDGGKKLNKDNNGRIVQGKPSLPYSLQKTIFTQIKKEFERKNIRIIGLS